jgi:hypothetical protein
VSPVSDAEHDVGAAPDAEDAEQARHVRGGGPVRRRLARPRALTGPLAELQVATLVLTVGSGAWFTCWALFFTRSVGLSAREFGLGVTVAAVLALVLGSPLGYLADRVGTREVLICLGLLQGVATLCYLAVSGFAGFLAVSVVAVTAQRVAPGIRVAVIAGLSSGPERLHSISANRVIQQVGLTVGSLFGSLVLAVGTRSAYVALVVLYGVANLASALLLLRVHRVPRAALAAGRRGMRVLGDRPFLLITLLSGVLALNWGVLGVGLPLWISAHTRAPLWTVGLFVAGNALAIVFFQNRVSRAAEQIAVAARQGIYSGVALAASCLLFALSYHRGGAPAIAILAGAVIVLTAGELLYCASGWGLSVALTPSDAHGEYQSTFAAGSATAVSFAPVLMAGLLVSWGVLGWFALAVLFLAAGMPTVPASRWAVRTRARLEPVS